MIDINKLASEHGSKLGHIAEIEEKEIEKFIYALKRLYKFTAYIIATFAASILLDIFIPVLVAFCTIFLLRIQFGGKHVENSWICLLVSTLIPLSLGAIAYQVSFKVETLIVIYIFAYIVAIFVGTVDNEKRRLSKERKWKHKIIGLILLTIIMIINFIMCIQNQLLIVNSMGLGVIVSFSNLIIVKN